MSWNNNKLYFKVKRITKDYFKYNPNGKTFYTIKECDTCGSYYIEEVGIMTKEDKKDYSNTVLEGNYGENWFTIFRSNKGLYKTAFDAKRVILKRIRENKNY